MSANTCVKPLHIFYRHFLRNGLILGFDYLLKDFASISSNITVPSQPRHIVSNIICLLLTSGLRRGEMRRDNLPHLRQIIHSIPTSWPISARHGSYIPDLYDLYDLAYVVGWERKTCLTEDMLPGLDLHVLNRSCTTIHNGRSGSR